MGIYSNHVLPRIINKACGMKTAIPLREQVCAGLHGRVLEIGFGSGLNVPYYPAAVTSVAAIEPSDVGWKLANKRLAAAQVSVERTGLDGQSIPLPDDSCDTALSTWTLCTIPDVAAALREVRRVLKPGGTLHFVEHGLAPDDKVQRWQHRLEPMQKRAFGGCHLTRPIADLLSDAGFSVTELDVFYEKGAPKPMGADSLGIASSSSEASFTGALAGEGTVKEFHGSATAQFDEPAEAVFDLITDIDRLPAWNAAIEEVAERPAEVADGVEWLVVMHPPHMPAWQSRSRVEEVDRSTMRFAYETRNADGNPSYVKWTWEVAPADGGATVTVHWDVYLKTLDRKLMAGPLRRRQLAREVPKSLNAMAAELERTR